MRYVLSFLLAGWLPLAVSCSADRATHITEISDLPLRSAERPGISWAESPLRANANYVLHGAESHLQREARVGDYYFVSWYDAAPEEPVRLAMHYTQAKTASQILTRTEDLPAPRKGRAHRKAHFFFAGKERKEKGDILSWRIELYVGGKLVDARQSYLWE